MSAKVAKTSVKPKGKISAFAYFSQSFREEMKDKNIPFGELSKQAGAKWQGMGEKAKQRFNELAARDKTRYDLEMKSYVPPPKGKEEDGKGKKRKRTSKDAKDPNAPKRPMTAYFLYLNDNRESLKKEKPDIKVTEVTKVLGARWQNESAAVKKKYEDKNKALKEKYEKDMANYNKRANTGGKGKAPSSPEEEDDDEDEEDDEGSE